MRKTLALCIPAFNASRYLPALFDSIREQAVPFDEILVYNDCSTDDTEEVAKSFGATVINGDINRGCSFGKNKLAEISTSEWIHFHDVDDILLPNFTKVAHNWINQEIVADIILLNYEYRDFSTKEILHIPNYDKTELKSDPRKFVIVNKIVNFALVNRDQFLYIGGFDLDTKVLYNEDRAFYSRAVIHGVAFDYEPEITCVNYRYTQSMSASNEVKCIKAYLHVSEKIADVFGRQYPGEIARGLWNNAKSAAALNDWELMRDNIKLAVKLAGIIPAHEGKTVRLLSRISPYKAFWIREQLIRLLKPHLRNHAR